MDEHVVMITKSQFDALIAKNDKTLRDEIAIAAMQGFLMSPHKLVHNDNTNFSQRDIADMSYCIANAMMAERNKNA